MVLCPRCQQPVDETARATCPICFTPLQTPDMAASSASAEQTAPIASEAPAPPPPPAAPLNTVPQQPPMAPTAPTPLAGMAPPVQPHAPTPAYAPPPQPLTGGPAMPPPVAPAAPMPGSVPRPGVRVSLTGEVIEDRAPAAPPPSYVGAAPAPQMPNPAARVSAMRQQELPRSGSSGTVIAVVVALAVLLLGGGGYWYLMNRTNPKDQVQKLFEAFKKKDWETVYSMSELSEESKKQIPDAKAYADQMNQNGQRIPGGWDTVLNGLTLVKVGEPTFSDGEATVSADIKISLMGFNQTVKQQFRLKNHLGIWKIVEDKSAINSLAGMGGGGRGVRGGMGNFGGMGGM